MTGSQIRINAALQRLQAEKDIFRLRCTESKASTPIGVIDAESDSHPIHRSELLDFAKQIELLLEHA